MTINRYRGDTFPGLYIIQETTGRPMNIQGWSAVLTISTERSPKDSASQVAQVVGQIGDAAAGEVSFVFPADIEAGTYFYDLQTTDTSGEIRTWVKEMLIIEQDITK